MRREADGRGLPRPDATAALVHEVLLPQREREVAQQTEWTANGA